MTTDLITPFPRPGGASAGEEEEQEVDVEKCSTTTSDDDDASVDSDPEVERRLLWKLDLCVLVWAWLAYCIKQIDSGNYKTAYASGMKEDLGLYGNELNYMDTFFRIGYAIFLIPSQLILTKVPAGYWLPALEVAWGLMTGLMAVVSNVKGIYVLRFFIGVFEASSYPGIISVLCNFYTPSELATRIAIFSTSYPGANIFVSFMQAALYEGMEGKAGLRGWQWLFVFNAIMTVVVALAGFFLIPDKPGNTRVRWLNTAEQRVAKLRMSRVNKLPPTGLSLATLKKIFSSWLIYIFTFTYCTWGWSQNSNTWIILFLKAQLNPDGTHRFGISERNAIPIGGYVLQIIFTIAFGWLSDRTNWRASLVVVQEVTLAFGAIILACWPSSFGFKMFAYFTLWLSNAAGPILIAWMADLTPSPEERSVIIGVCITLLYVVDSFANIFIYPAAEAPHYKIGYKAAAGFALGCCTFTGLWRWLEQRRATPTQEEASSAGDAENPL